MKRFYNALKLCSFFWKINLSIQIQNGGIEPTNASRFSYNGDVPITYEGETKNFRLASYSREEFGFNVYDNWDWAAPSICTRRTARMSDVEILDCYCENFFDNIYAIRCKFFQELNDKVWW